ncbi:MAG TPA: DUF3775 domain-containing protein [Xanthobacteraceae bacterium]|nr:DUF3775 domain-containing protein [Xanthobacteraceae bacterium]
MPDIDLDISPEKVAWIIVRAREFEAKVQPFNADEETAAEEHSGILEDRHFNPTLRELAGFLHALNEDELANLVALTWIGRGTYEASQWQEVLRRARDNSDVSPERYLLRTPMLAEYLEAGLDAVGYRPAELEQNVS